MWNVGLYGGPPGQACGMHKHAGALGASWHATTALPCRYVKTFGPEANLFVDHSQVVQLECLRRGIWGTKSTWGRMLSYKGSGGVAA